MNFIYKLHLLLGFKRRKTSYKTAFVSCIESDSCIITFLKVLSKTSKGRYLDFKRASFTSQKGVNWKPIYALFVCSIRILFTKYLVLTKAIENLKGRSMRESIVLLLLCLQLTLSTSNSLTCLLVNLSTKESFFRYSVFQLPCLQLTRQLVYSLTRQLNKTLLYLLFFL